MVVRAESVDFRKNSFTEKIGKFLVMALFFNLLSACDAQPQQAERSIVIAGETLSVPVSFNHWRSKIGGDAKGGSFQKIEFSLDLRTLENVKTVFGEGGEFQVHVEVRPLSAEFGERYYWTDSDPALRQPVECEDVLLLGNQLKVCRYDDAVRVNTSAYGGLTIHSPRSNDLIAVAGCSDPEGKLKTLRKVCTGRSRIRDNLQIEYVYAVSHFVDAVEIDEKLRKLIADMIESNLQ